MINRNNIYLYEKQQRFDHTADVDLVIENSMITYKYSDHALNQSNFNLTKLNDTPKQTMFQTFLCFFVLMHSTKINFTKKIRNIFLNKFREVNTCNRHDCTDRFHYRY